MTEPPDSFQVDEEPYFTYEDIFESDADDAFDADVEEAYESEDSKNESESGC